MNQLVLSFVGTPSPELYETFFVHPLAGGARRCVRGKSGGAFRGCSSFQWTRAVQALAILVIRTKELRAGNDERLPVPPLVGSAGSLAASLDYSVDKQTNWLLDMFGVDSAGTPLVRRLLLRSNSGRKRPGPVAIALNTSFMALDRISILWDFAELTTPEQFTALEQALTGSVGNVAPTRAARSA